MHLRCAVVLSIPLLLGLPGCGDNQEPSEARDLWSTIQDEDYRSFQRAPGYETRQASDTAHSDQVDIYVNSVLADSLASGEALGSWPVGSLIVKDGFRSNDTLALVAVMEKRSAGWFYAEYTTFAGDALYSGAPEVCVNCHSSGSDFVRAFGFP